MLCERSTSILGFFWFESSTTLSISTALIVVGSAGEVHDLSGNSFSISSLKYSFVMNFLPMSALRGSYLMMASSAMGNLSSGMGLVAREPNLADNHAIALLLSLAISSVRELNLLINSR